MLNGLTNTANFKDWEQILKVGAVFKEVRMLLTNTQAKKNKIRDTQEFSINVYICQSVYLSTFFPVCLVCLSLSVYF